jgi:hypothetical protein
MRGLPITGRADAPNTRPIGSDFAHEHRSRSLSWASVELGASALDIPRQSVPSLLMVTEDLVSELCRRYDGEPAAADYLDRIGTLANSKRS